MPGIYDGTAGSYTTGTGGNGNSKPTGKPAGGTDYTTAGGPNNGVSTSLTPPGSVGAAMSGGLLGFLGVSNEQVWAGVRRFGIISLGAFIGLVGFAVIIAGTSGGKKALSSATGAAKGAVGGLVAGPEGAAVGAVAGAAGGAVSGGE